MLKSDLMIRHLAADLRDARLAAGLSQRQIALAIGVPRSTIERLELGQLPNLSIRAAAMTAAAVGLDLGVATYPGGRHARDVAQIRLLERLRARLGLDWRWQYEVPLPLDRDRRAWDASAVHATTGIRIRVEAETRFRDVQGVLRRIALKRRDDGSPRVVLLASDTRTNRLRWHDAEAIFTDAFPVGTRAALSALALGRDPGRDALVFL